MLSDGIPCPLNKRESAVGLHPIAEALSKRVASLFRNQTIVITGGAAQQMRMKELKMEGWIFPVEIERIMIVLLLGL